MRYIALNSRKLGAAPPSSRVFPFLQEDDVSTGGNDHQVYAWSLMVADDNEQAVEFLRSIGFAASADPAPVTGWQFWVAKSGTPIQPLTNLSTAEDKKKLATYLRFTFANPPDHEWPASVTVVEPNIDQSLFDPASGFDLMGVVPKKSSGVPDGWSWTLQADLDGDGTLDDDVLPGWKIPLEIRSPVDNGKRELVFSLLPFANGDEDADWEGCELQLDGLTISGPTNTPLVVGDFRVFSDGEGWNFASAQETIKFDLGTRVNFSVSVLGADDTAASLEVRYRSDRRDVSILDDEPTIKIHAAFPLIMAPASSSPAAIAMLVPLLTDTLRELFQFEFHIRPGKSISLALLVVNEDGDWSLNQEFWKLLESEGWEFSAKWIEDDDAGLQLGGMEWSLGELVAELLNVSFQLKPFTRQISDSGDSVDRIPCRIQGGALHIPILLDFSAGDRGRGLEFCLDLSIDLKTFRLATNQLGFRLPTANFCSGTPILDLIAFAIILPQRGAANYFDGSSLDGYLDFDAREFVLFAAVDGSVLAPILTVPGNLSGDLSQRLVFQFEPFYPDSWPKTDATKRPVFLRVNGEGISLYAKILTEHRPNVLKGNEQRRPLGIAGQRERDGKVSEVVIINNRVARAVFFGELEVPGVDDLVAKVEIGMSQDRRGRPPTIHAQIDLDSTNGKPIASLSAGFMKIQIDDMRARLAWNLDDNSWDMSVPVDASFLLGDDITNSGGLDDLADPDVIKVTGLDLLNIHDGFGSITLPLPDNVNFTCLDGMFGVSLANLSFTWGESFGLACDTAAFTFRDPGAFDVTIEVGGVKIDFFPGGRVKMANPSRLGIDATIGDNVRFRGAVAWVDNERENYFAAAGTLAIEGMPEAKTLLKIGTGKKNNGQIVPSIVLYGAIDLEVQLFSGVVAKNFGAGIGINNRLTGISERPTAEQMIERIDDVEPSRIEGWSFVERNGFYLSIVGTTIIASNTGGNSQVNAYVASVVLSIDLDLNIVAAAKVWLASSVDFVRQGNNWNRPALIGAIAILPRERLFTAAVESRSQPAIESSELLSKILDKGKIRMAFVLSPSLVDFHLKEVSYRDNFLGFDMLFQGRFRLAAFDGVLLVRAGYSITGRFDKRMEAGPGGFHARGNLFLGIEYGGLLSQRGLAVYGIIGLQVNLDVSAWITIGFSFTIGWGRWKKRISFEKTFSLATTRLEIGFDGAAGFNESGQFGFVGRLSIAVSICGYKLSISPSFVLNESVIQDVRARVSAFESRLEDYRKRLIAGPETVMATRSLAMAESTMGYVVKERWLHYQSGDLHLLIPHPGEKWFTPFVASDASLRNGDEPVPFRQHVLAIKIENATTGGEAIELKMPWLRGAWGSVRVRQSPQIRQRLEEIELTMAESVSEATEFTPVPVRQKHYVVSDPRVESDDREYWLAEDQALLPDYALPIRMKSADQVLQSNEIPEDFSSDFGRLADYLYWARHATDYQRHQGEDLLEEDELEQRRAVVLHEILQALQGKEVSVDSDTASAWLATDNGEEAVCGLIFKTSSDQLNSHPASGWNVSIIRDGEDRPIIADVTHVRDSVRQARDSVQLLPPRQQFVADAEGESGSHIGHVVVALPIKLNDKNTTRSTFIDDHLPLFSHFEVYRRIRGREKPILVGGFQLPTLKRVPVGDIGQPVVVAEPYIFTERFIVKEDQNGNRELSDNDLDADETVIEYAIRMVPVGDDPSDQEFSPWRGVKLHLPQKDEFPIDLEMVFNVRSLYRPIDVAGSDWMKFQLVTQKDAKPAIAMTDGWSQQARPQSDSEELPFEIWAEEHLISDSGFYAGSIGEDSGRADQEPDLRRLDAEESFAATDGKWRCKVEPVVESVGETKPSYLWRLAWDELQRTRMMRPGYGYRFYVRSRRKGSRGLETYGPLRQLRTSLTKQDLDDLLLDSEKPPTWKEAPRLRAIALVEWIDQREVDAIRKLCKSPAPTPPENVVPVSASVRGLEQERIDDESFDDLRRRIGIGWRRPLHVPATTTPVDLKRCLPSAGITIQVLDQDDSALRSSFVCETMHRESYQLSIADFSNDSAWRLTCRECTQRLTTGRVPSGEPDDFDASSDAEIERIIDQTLDLVTEDSAGSLIKTRSDNLKKELASDGASWPTFAKAAALWVDALHEFERSPLNLNDPTWKATTGAVVALIRWTLMGYQPLKSLSVDELSIERIETMDQEIRSLVERIESLRPAASDFSDADETGARRAYLDSDYGRKLAAIVRRRLALADDVISSRREDLPLADALAEKNQYWIIREIAFERLREKSARATQILGGSLPETSRLLSLFPASSIVEKPPTWASGELVKALDRVKQLVDYLRPNDEIDLPRREKASAVAAKAAGLNRVLIRIEDKAQQRGVAIKSLPHHRVGVANTDDGTRVPQRVALRDLLPDDLRQIGTDGDTVQTGTRSESAIVAYMNLLERLGFALDIGATNQVGKRIDQNVLMDIIRSTDLSGLFLYRGESGKLERHFVFLFTPREPDSEYKGEFPDPVGNDAQPYAYTGFSFVKLAVVPESFVSWLANLDTKRIAFVKRWLTLRGIDTDENDDHALAQVEVFASAARLVGFGDFPGGTADETPIVQVRLTPLELQRMLVPHSAGVAHIDFESRDRRGHRYEVSARSMSRYELLVRWAENLPAPETSHSGTNVSVRRIATGSDGVDLPIPLPVSVYPHPEKIQFAYTLPPAGIRSVLNRISAVRTGYKGCHAEFDYQLIDHDSRELSWDNVLRVTKIGAKSVVDEPVIATATIRNSSSVVKLFRHQRLVTLPHVPHFYSVTLSTHALYDSDVFVDDADKRLLENDSARFNVDPARRLPALIAYRRPVVTQEDDGTLSIRLLLSRLAEMNRPEDLAGGTPIRRFPITLHNSDGTPASEVTLSEGLLPDLTLGYHFYHLVGEELNPADRVYESVVDLVMPWHPEYISPDTGDVAPPMVRTLSKSDIEVLQRYPTIQWHSVEGSAEPVFVPMVTIRLRVKQGELFTDPDRRYLQVSCLGKLSQATLVAKDEIND